MTKGQPGTIRNHPSPANPQWRSTRGEMTVRRASLHRASTLLTGPVGFMPCARLRPSQPRKDIFPGTTGPMPVHRSPGDLMVIHQTPRRQHNACAVCPHTCSSPGVFCAASRRGGRHTFRVRLPSRRLHKLLGVLPCTFRDRSWCHRTNLSGVLCLAGYWPNRLSAHTCSILLLGASIGGFPLLEVKASPHLRLFLQCSDRLAGFAPVTAPGYGWRPYRRSVLNARSCPLSAVSGRF